MAFFNAAEDVCETSKISDGLLRLTKNAILLTNESDAWRLLSRSDVPLFSQPAVLWLLESIFGSKSFGRLGASLNAQTQNVEYRGPGPFDESPLQNFVHFKKNSKFEIDLSVKNNVQLLPSKNWSEGLTWAIWFKTKSPVIQEQPIFGFYLNDSIGPHLWLYPNETGVKILFSLSLVPKKNLFYLRLDSVNKWRHIAVTYDADQEAHFFIDGLLKDFESKNVDTEKIQEFSKLNLGSSAGPENLHFNGELSCAVIFERALRAEEVKWLMNSCP